MTWASYGLLKFASMREPQVVSTPRVQKMSLCAIGIPVSGPAGATPFPARRASALFASACARASSTVMNALSSPFSFEMRSRCSRVSSSEEIFLLLSAAASSERDEFSKAGYSITLGTR